MTRAALNPAGMEQEQEESAPVGNHAAMAPQTRSSSTEEECGTATRRKRKKKKDQMESIIVYRSDAGEQDADGVEGVPGEGGSGTGDIAEEGMACVYE